MRFILLIVVTAIQSQAQFRYPAIRTESFDTTIHGVRLQDEFFWMERTKHQGEVKKVAKEQTDFSRVILNSLDTGGRLADAIYEGLAVMDDEIWNLEPVRSGYYFNKYIPEEGSWLCHADDSSPDLTKVLRDVEINGRRYAIRRKVFAFGKPLVALMLTEGGERNPHIRIYDLNSKEFLPDSIGPVMFNDSRGVSMAWLPDDAALLYTQAPATVIRSEKYFRGNIKTHRIGASDEEDSAVFGVGLISDIKLQPHETPYVYTFGNSSYVLARIRAGDGDNYAFAVHYSELNGSKTPWKRLKEYVNLGDAFDAYGNTLYAATTGVPRYQVVKINLATAAPPEPFLHQQEDVIAGTDMMFNSGIVAGQDVVYVLIRRVGAMYILMVDRKTGKAERVPLKRTGSIADMNLQGKNDIVFAYMSATTTMQYLRYDFDQRTIVDLPFANKVHDADWLTSKVIYVPSRDGESIPVSLVYPRDLNLQGNNRLILEAYGNSGTSRDLYMDPQYFPWFRNGGVWAYAHVRGGGELGEEWTNDGQYPNKMNSIFDVVDVAEYFVKEGYSSPQKQVLMGASAGTFLVGMAINQRPDLFAAGLFLSGLPDIATHTDAAFGREQKSVGSKLTRDGWLSNLSISSLYHIPRQTKLPAMLVVHGATDYALGSSPAVRYIARLQQAQKGDRPTLLLVDPLGGHLGGTAEMIDILKFSLWQTGHPDFQCSLPGE